MLEERKGAHPSERGSGVGGHVCRVRSWLVLEDEAAKADEKGEETTDVRSARDARHPERTRGATTMLTGCSLDRCRGGVRE